MVAYHTGVGDGTHMTLLSVGHLGLHAQAYGCIVADEQGLVQHYVEKPRTHVSDDINCGVYLLSPAVFADMAAAHLARMDSPDAEQPAVALSLERDIIIPLCLAGSERVFMYRTKAFWTQIKTAAATVYANRHYLERLRATNPALLASAGRVGRVGVCFVSLSAAIEHGFHVVGDVLVDGTAEIAPSAKVIVVSMIAACLTGIAHDTQIGPNVSIGPGVVVGPGARIKDAIILEGVVLGVRCC